MKKGIRKEGGFTLVELLIVVIILGILAAVAIPQFSTSTDDAKLSTLDSNLGLMRNSSELYYNQHNSSYPGAKKVTDGTVVATIAECATAFTDQMTIYTEVDGVTSNSRTVAAKYGPYIKNVKLPMNPFNDLNTVLCDITETDITVAASSGAAGWKFYVLTGRLIANDGAHDAN